MSRKEMVYVYNRKKIRRETGKKRSRQSCMKQITLDLERRFCKYSKKVAVRIEKTCNTALLNQSTEWKRKKKNRTWFMGSLSLLA